MKRFRVVCIGAGYFAKYHVEAWKRIPEVELVAICDLEIEKAQKLADEFQIPNVYQSVNELNEALSYDIIDIITPPEGHLSLCTQAASRGLHIICQKPLTPTFAEAKKLANMINEVRVRFMVHENFRFQPWYRKIKSLMDQGAIGDTIYSINHRMRMGDGWSDDAYLSRQPYFREMPRLLIHETGIHIIDVFRYLLGEVSSVFTKLRTLNKNIKGEDNAIVFFEFENGCHGIFDGNRYNESNASNPRYTFGEMLLEGSKGTLRLETNGSLFHKPLGEEEIEIVYDHEDINFAGDCVYTSQKHFIECLQSGMEFETNAEDYINNLIIEEAIYSSHEHKNEIKIKEFLNVIK